MLKTNLGQKYYSRKSKILYLCDVNKSFKKIKLLKEIDKYTFVPNILLHQSKDNEPIYSFLEYPLCGEVVLNDDIANVKLSISPLCEQVVTSSFHRWMNGFGASLKDYWIHNDEVICVGFQHRFKKDFPLSDLTPKLEEEYLEILYFLWDELVKPYFIRYREYNFLPSSLLQICKVDSSTLDICDKDMERLDKYPTFASKAREYSLDQACGSFVSTFVAFPSREEILKLALSFLSKKSVVNIYDSIMELTEKLEEKTPKQLTEIALTIYQIFGKTERNREIYFSSFLIHENEEQDFSIEESKEYSFFTNKLIRTFRKMPQLNKENFEFSIPLNKIILCSPSTYEGLVCGPLLDEKEIRSEKLLIDYSFSFFFEEGMRCSRPSDVFLEDNDTLYAVAMNKIFQYTYVGDVYC